MTFLRARRASRRSELLRAGQASGPGNPRSAFLPVAGVTLLMGAVLFYVGSLRYSIPEAVLAVLLGALVLALVPWAISGTGSQAQRAFWVSTPRTEAAPPSALDYRLVRLRRDLRDAVERDDRSDEIYPVLRDLAAERLLSTHGIDLDTEPERAREVTDPHLWHYLTHPPTDTRKRSRSSLHAAIEGIEKL